MTESPNAVVSSISFRVTAVDDFAVADIPAELAPLKGSPEHASAFGSYKSCIRITLGELIKVERVGISKLPEVRLSEAGPIPSIMCENTNCPPFQLVLLRESRRSPSRGGDGRWKSVR